jgi:hypothetical protein
MDQPPFQLSANCTSHPRKQIATNGQYLQATDGTSALPMFKLHLTQIAKSPEMFHANAEILQNRSPENPEPSAPSLKAGRVRLHQGLWQRPKGRKP